MTKKSNHTLLFILTIASALIVRTFFFSIRKVQGDSMNPNLRSGEFILVNLWTKDFTPGDVVVFNVGQVKETFIKRIIAGEGNTVYVDNYRVYLNGAASEATSYQVQWDLNDLFCKYSEIYTLKENEFFMMGDNRCSSSDSRSFGPVSKDKILGKVITSLRF